MKDWTLSLYHRLPPPARSLAANVRGLYLRHWRIGPKTEQWVAEATEREGWTREHWQTWQEEQLARVLDRAAKHVPYYRAQWAKRRRAGDRVSWEYLENWPVLGKETLRTQSEAFVADDCDVRRMFHERTSGTTGKPLDIWFSKDVGRKYYALFEARLRRWHGVNWHDHWAILGGQPIVPATTKEPPYWVWNTAMSQLYLSANHLSPQNVPAYVAALARHNVNHLIAYSSSISFLAREIKTQGLQIPGLKVVITNAEPLLPWQREVINQGLNCKVQETYGMAEMVTAASTCDANVLHSWPEVGWLEILHDVEETPLALGDTGRLVCTSLLNTDMPLIRYAVGDRGQLAPDDTPCRCGRRLPAVAGIQGRINDLLITRDGRRVYWLNPVFYGMPIREAQIIQESLDYVRVRFVPAIDYTAQAGHSIIERLNARLGPVNVILESVPEIPLAANGKFRAVICNLSPEERGVVHPSQDGDVVSV